MSIVRVGLAESGNFGEGYEAIFGKKKEAGAQGKKAKTDKPAAKTVRSAPKKTKADKPAAKAATKSAPKKAKKPTARKK